MGKCTLAVVLGLTRVMIGCDYIAPPRWVLWGDVGGGWWAPINEYRTLAECNKFKTDPKFESFPYGTVPSGELRRR
jgi:hypothetical protein